MRRGLVSMELVHHKTRPLGLGLLTVIGYKDLSASRSHGRSYSTAYGTCSVHHCCFIFEDILHIDCSFRSRPATITSQASVTNAFG